MSNFRPYLKKDKRNWKGHKAFTLAMRELSGNLYVTYEVPQLEALAQMILSGRISAESAIEQGAAFAGGTA